MKKCLVIYNPNSGKYNKEEILPKIKKILEGYNYEVDVVATKGRGDATEIVSTCEYKDLLISIGGDGTFNEVMTGNFNRNDRLVLCHLPSGTTNDIGTMWGYGKNMISNLKLALNGKVKQIDICTINDKPFVYSAGFGKFMNIPYETPRELKKNLGYLAYISEGVKSFFNKTKLSDITYEIDGVEHRGLFSFLILSSANRISGINNFYKDVKLDDNKFEVLLCNITKKADIVRSLYFLTMYDVSKVPGIYSYKASNMKIKFSENPKKAWCVDGEKLEDIETEYDIRIDNSLKMMIPSKNVDKLFINKK